MNLKYLVTGTGRCGTMFMARSLTRLGVPCGHESVFCWKGWPFAQQVLQDEQEPTISNVVFTRFDGKSLCEVPEWVDIKEIQADSSYMAAPFLNNIDTTVIHVVRHPVKVVNSFCNYLDYFHNATPNPHYEEFMHSHIPELGGEMTQYDRACLFCIRWIKMIEDSGKVDHLHKIESHPDKFWEKLGLSGSVFKNNQTNTYKRNNAKRFTVDQIMREDIKEEFIDLGRSYNYNMACDVPIL